MAKSSPGNRKTCVPHKRLAAIFRMTSGGGRKRRRKLQTSPRPQRRPKFCYRPKPRRKLRQARPKR